MAEKGFIFNGEMVSAILDGRKTMARMVIKPQPEGQPSFCYAGSHNSDIGKWHHGGKRYTPPCHAGDLLYVRETWCNEWKDHDGWTGGYLYRADGTEVADVDGGISKSPWRPSIHMPKAAARIWLEVTDVRVERLQDMKLSDIYAEGIVSKPSPDKEALNPWKLFIDLWDSIAYKNDKTRFKTECGQYMWKSNPYVWVIEFRKVEHG